EPIAGRFPEAEAVALALPEVVLVGQLLAWDELVLRCWQMRRRILRKMILLLLLNELPVVLLACDLLSFQGNDWRKRPLALRHRALEGVVEQAANPALRLSPITDARDWPALAVLRDGSRERGVEGLMLKRRASPYRSGRVRGDWWKWKID